MYNQITKTKRMSMKKFIVLSILNIMFASVTLSQEWQYQLEWGDLSNVEYSIGDVQELSSRNLISTATLYTKESMEDNYSISPAVFSFSTPSISASFSTALPLFVPSLTIS